MAEWNEITNNDEIAAYQTRVKEFIISVEKHHDGRYWVRWWLAAEGFQQKTLHGHVPIERADGGDFAKAKREGLYVFRDWLAKWVYELNKELPPPRRELREDVGTAFNDFLPRCANCYEVLGNSWISKSGETEKFCSQKCADEFYGLE